MMNLNISQRPVLAENERDRFREESRLTHISPLLQWLSLTSKFFNTSGVARPISVRFDFDSIFSPLSDLKSSRLKIFVMLKFDFQSNDSLRFF